MNRKEKIFLWIFLLCVTYLTSGLQTTFTMDGSLGGRIITDRIYRIINNTSIFSCALQCLKYKYCTSFAYKITKQRNLYNDQHYGSIGASETGWTHFQKGNMSELRYKRLVVNSFFYYYSYQCFSTSY